MARESKRVGEKGRQCVCVTVCVRVKRGGGGKVEKCSVRAREGERFIQPLQTCPFWPGCVYCTHIHRL